MVGRRASERVGEHLQHAVPGHYCPYAQNLDRLIVWGYIRFFAVIEYASEVTNQQGRAIYTSI